MVSILHECIPATEFLYRGITLQRACQKCQAVSALTQQFLHASGQFLFILCHSSPVFIHPLLWAEIVQAHPLVLQMVSCHGYFPLEFFVHLLPHAKQFLHCLPVIKHRQLRCCRRSRCPQVCDIICNRKVRLMTDSGDHRNPAVKNGPCHHFFVKCPQILYGSTAPSDNDYIHADLFKCMNSMDN